MEDRTWICHRIADTGFGTTAARYADCQAVALRQYWESPAAFPKEPALARVGWNTFGLCAYVELTDSDIFTRATADNQKFWELGDTCEFFIKPGVNQPMYWEIHVSPNNLKLDLQIPDRDIMQQQGIPTWEELIRSDSHCQKLGRILPGATSWTAELWVPWSAFGMTGCPGPGAEWNFAVSRYNYTTGVTDPEYSSSAFLTKLSYHRHEEFHRLVFAE
jgi:hypothetical protein